MRNLAIPRSAVALRTLTALISLLALAASCAESPSPVKPDQEPTEASTALVPDDGAVRVGETIRIRLLSLAPTDSVRIINWSSDRGSILGDDENATYTAPVAPGTARIMATAVTAAEDTLRLALHLPIYRQWVVIKADDLTASSGRVAPGFERLFRFLDDQGIVGGVGLIGNSLEKGGVTYAAALRSELATGRIEIYNHGYDHSGNTPDAHGVLVFEFQNTALADQITHLQRTQDLARLALGVVLRTFAAPFNAIDSVTVEALRAVPDIEVWMFGWDGAGKLVLPRVAEAEFPIFYPDAAQFAAHYDATPAIVTLQIHPAGWNDAKWAEFGKIVSFLKDRQATFALPSDIYRYLHPDAANYLSAPGGQSAGS